MSGAIEVAAEGKRKFNQHKCSTAWNMIPNLRPWEESGSGLQRTTPPVKLPLINYRAVQVSGDYIALSVA